MWRGLRRQFDRGGSGPPARAVGTDPPDNVVGEDRRRVVEGMPRAVRLRLIGCPNTGDRWRRAPVARSPSALHGPRSRMHYSPGEHDPGVEGVQYIVGNRGGKGSWLSWRTPRRIQRPGDRRSLIFAVAQVQAQRGDCDGSTRMIHLSHPRLGLPQPVGVVGTDLDDLGAWVAEQPAESPPATMMPKIRRPSNGWAADLVAHHADPRAGGSGSAPAAGAGGRKPARFPSTTKYPVGTRAHPGTSSAR